MATRRRDLFKRRIDVDAVAGSLIIMAVALLVGAIVYFLAGAIFNPSEQWRLPIVGFFVAFAGSFGCLLVIEEFMWPLGRFWSDSTSRWVCLAITVLGTALAWVLSTQTELVNLLILTTVFAATLAGAFITRLLGNDLG